MDEVTQKEESLKLKEAEVVSDGNSSEDGSDSTSELLNDIASISISEDYEVLECVGKGGMGTVYKVKDITQDKIFAVKVLQKQLAADASALKRFEQETESASKLSHSNLVSVYKHGKTDSGEPYLVMDYLEGKSLSQVIDDEEKLDNKRALDIFIQICDGLEHAHENGVIHRDIKPTNIILTKDESGKEVAKLVDFGIAKVMNATNRETHDLTQTGEVFGSPHYMSPEQCLGFMLKEQSDIYSLGCSLYESITGEPPFGGSNPIQLVVKHINDDVEGFDKSLKKTKMGKQLERVTLKCVEKEPQNRFQSVQRLRADLENIRDGKKIPLYDVKSKAKPTLTKRQMLVGFAITIGLFIAIMMTSSLYGYQYSSIAANSLLTVIILASFSALTAVGIDKAKGILGNKRSAKDWWIMLVSLTGGLAGLLVIPNMIYSGYSQSSTSPHYLDQLVTACSLLDAFLVLMFASSVLGILLFRKLKSVSPTYIIVRQLIITIVLVVSPCLLAPNLVSRVVHQLANKSYTSFPDLSKILYYLNTKLETEGTTSYRTAADLEFKAGNKEQAFKLLDAAIAKSKEDKDKVSILENKVEFLSKDKKYKEAIEELNNAISKYTDNDTGKPIGNLLTERARIFQNANMPDKALQDLDTFLKDKAGDSHSYDTKASILCSQGKYEEALGVLQQAVNTYDSDSNRHFTLALIKEKLGLNIEAISDYKRVLKKNEWIKNHTVDKYAAYSLQNAYALKKLGKLKEYNDLNSKLKKAGIERDKLFNSKSIKETGLKPNWN